jgi:hypothetical protein
MIPTKFRIIWASGFRGEQTWPPQPILVSDWLISKKSSLKLLVQMNLNLVGSIYGRSSIKIAHFVPIH